ncbi:hypothetical protein N8500_03840 [Candidatus Puniceispirillum sp.]|nr:hypothetical protein [Candidatus Puniceispirillum sp.]
MTRQFLQSQLAIFTNNGSCRKQFLYLGVIVIGLFTSSVMAQTPLKSGDAKLSTITIEASEFLEWNQTDGTYIAKGNAYVKQDQASIEAEHIVAHYALRGESRDITRVVASGAVTYVEGENTAKGEKLEYDLTTKLYVLTGKNSSVTSPRGTVAANKSITYDSTNLNNLKVIAIGEASYENTNGRNIFGNKLIAFIASDGTLKTIDAYDNTKVITADGTIATSDKLNYVAKTSLANLNGNVEILDKGNIMRGARAEIDFDKEISKILSSPSGKRVSGTLSP